MISYEKFSKIRFSDYYDSEDIELVNAFSYKGELWDGEKVYDNTCLQARDESDSTKCLSLDFDREFYDEINLKILKDLGLNIKPFTKLKNVIDIYGQPINIVNLLKKVHCMNF